MADENKAHRLRTMEKTIFLTAAAMGIDIESVLNSGPRSRAKYGNCKQCGNPSRDATCFKCKANGPQ